MAKGTPTLRHVAELAGVSRTTVSFVLDNVSGMRISPKTRQRTKCAALRLNYHPNAIARRMVSVRTLVIGFVPHPSVEPTLAVFLFPPVSSEL